ncbi:hypothetical protein SAMN05660649_03144 [Desulfotomaculum arcticum]|uniref:Phage head-tail joining protein n=1 Tax=Desulfotruncus arcticus DSM 17038 TaxID=1121424 RepID=A0A1I2VYM0_9FIRM|nr:hypothetical protein [Desulfotruncus arcticus]SFG92401.1 hypothetical protein SAMN05660649_03144 [Desulfotomaculum arcticum] [Desulfotruncus arcticus DSM 17038]
MFNDTLIKVYSSSDSTTFVKSIYADIQPFSKSITFEDGFQIDVTSRVFCDVDDSITKDSYLEIENLKYKVMEIKKWDDYLEVYLYKLVRQV